ncbi:MAG: hypothetical protein ACOYLH_03280 [Flavobacteriales bacterium]|jgi:hypothetical protein
MKRWLVLFGFCVGMLSVEAQSVNLSDSLRDIFHATPKPSIRLDSRNSFITGQSVKVGGVKIGATYKKCMTVGLGYNWLLSEIKYDVPEERGAGMARLRMNYIGPYIEYSFYRKYPWESIVVANLGYGNIYLKPDDRESKAKLFKTGAFFYEPSMAIDYKIGGWVAVGVGLGYRLVIRQNNDLDERFTAPVYVLRFRILFDKVEPLLRKQME